MNERILELLKQSYVTEPYYPAGNDGHPEYRSYINQEKFAELIVRECARIAVFKESGHIATAEVAGYMAAGRGTAARLIKEHFGVEE